MSEKKEFFADGIGQIHFAGGMVRLDFVTLAPEADGKAPSPRSNRRVILSPQGFPGAHHSMPQLIGKLADAGARLRNENATS